MRGNNRRTIFRDDVDYATFLRMLRGVQAQFGWTLHIYCLMPNHYHLVIQSDASLAKGMHLLNGRYARRFNVRHGHFEECCRYVAENPVRAGLCATPADWPWTGGDTYDCR